MLMVRNAISVETHRLSSLKVLLSSGSPLKAETFDYIYKNIKKDVLIGSISGILLLSAILSSSDK